MMYEKAKEDKTFKTDMAEEEFMRVTVHTMMTACAYYAGGFIWMAGPYFFAKGNDGKIPRVSG